jgi:hypothetical protein
MASMTAEDFRTMPLDELEAMPTLSEGQADDQKYEGEDDEGRFRVWLSRCTAADGEPFDNKVTIERYDGRRWYDAEIFPAEEG